jgi:phage terminase large subunit-like protein
MGRPRKSALEKALEGDRSRRLSPDEVLRLPSAVAPAFDFVGEVEPIQEPPTDVAGYNPLRDSAGFHWDGLQAARHVQFFCRRIRHVEGKFSGDPFRPEIWERDYLATLYGWVDDSGARRYRESLIGTPRKNGKTYLGAGISLDGLANDGEEGAQAYSAAYSRDQASLIYSPAARMVKADPVLWSKLKPIDSTRRIVYADRGSFFRSIPAEAANSHGFNASVVVFDEFHTQRTRDLYDVLKTSQGARSQPLFVVSSTAGYDKKSICHEVWMYARQVRDGIVKDPHFLPMLYELKEGENWQDEEVWWRCNPNLGVTIDPEFLRTQYKRAKESIAYENTFRNLFLNEWTEQAMRWLPMDKWALGNEALPDLIGAPCWGGLDLSTTTDLSALVLAFPVDGRMHLLARFWAPRERVRIRERRDRVPYSMWEKKGLLTLTEGDVIDYDVIRRDINELSQQYSIQELAIDRWNATQITTQLTGDGINVTQFGQGYASMSPAAKEFEKLVLGGQIQHGGHELLTWNAANVAIEQDPAGNIKPSKSASTERIDGIVAAVMAVGRATASQPQQWFYEKHTIEMA